jgi:hypothetical protein
MKTNDIRANPILLEVFEQLKSMPLLVFGSAATKGLANANDIDVVIDLDANPSHQVYLKPVRQLARKYYGWVDNFAIKNGELWVRNDEATAYVKAKNAAAILKNIKRDAKPISEIK